MELDYSLWFWLRMGALVLLVLVAGTCKLLVLGLFRREDFKRMFAALAVWVVAVGALFSGMDYLLGEKGSVLWVVTDAGGAPRLDKRVFFGEIQRALPGGGSVTLR